MKHTSRCTKQRKHPKTRLRLPDLEFSNILQHLFFRMAGAWEGCARLCRPLYAEANMGHPFRLPSSPTLRTQTGFSTSCRRLKTAVLNSLTSADGQRGYSHAIDEFVDWYCREPRLALNRTVVLRYHSYLEARLLAGRQV